MLCPSCGREVPPESQFCNVCGANLGARIDAPVAQTPTLSEEKTEETVLWSSGSFVGRRGELGDLKAVLEVTISGDGCLVMFIAIPPWLRQKADQARRAVDFDPLAVVKLGH